jgi:hypothetical protein
MAGVGSGIGYHKLVTVTGGSTINVDGVQVSSVCAGTSCSPTQTAGTYLISTASDHPFVVGDTVRCEYYSQTASGSWNSKVASVPSATSFTVSFGTNNFAVGTNTFGFCGIQNTFFEDNSDHVSVTDLNLTILNPTATGTFSYGIIADNDQDLHIVRAANRSTGVIKNSANFPMGAFILQRTDQGNAALVHVLDTELTNVNCFDGGGNGAEWEGGVCQAFPVFGVRYFGSLVPITIKDMYQSCGGVINPLYSGSLQGEMGTLMTGGQAGNRVLGTFPICAAAPQFASGGGAGALINYFICPHSSVAGAMPCFYAGNAEPASGSTVITVQWPSIQLQNPFNNSSLGTVTYDIIKTTGTAVPPYGTGNFSNAFLEGLTQSSVCGTNGICSSADAQSSLASYTVPSSYGFSGAFWWWPGALVNNSTLPLISDAGQTSAGVITTAGIAGVGLVTPVCVPGGPSNGRSAYVTLSLAITNVSCATVFNTLNGGSTQTKGRLNFGQYPAEIPGDWLTIQDNNYSKTATTAGHRPLNDAGDMAFSLDQTGGFATRAATSISSYIGTVADNTHYLERLTATAENYATNVAIAGPRPWIDVTGPGYAADPTGTADSTTALNAAFAACNGGTVFLPPNTGSGFYKHTGQLTISSAGCTIQSFEQGAIIKKGYNSTNGVPSGTNGSVLITASNVTIDGITYDGNNGSFTGGCFSFAGNISQVIFQNNYVHNCDGNSLVFTGASTGSQGPTNFKVLNNYIVEGENGFGLTFSQNISGFDVEGNRFDCSPSTANPNPGSACLQLESQGLTTSISHGKIVNNTIITPSCSGGECWGTQLGQFNAYASTDIVFGQNHTIISGPSANCGSFQGLTNSRFDLGVCEEAGNTANYAAWEFIMSNGINVTGGELDDEGPGDAVGIIISSTSNSNFSGLTINGFGESPTGGVTAGLEITSAASGGSQAIASCTETGNVATYTVSSPPLNANFQPPAAVFLGGSYTPAGFGGGPYAITNTNYNRISGTFSVILPVTGLGTSCSGTSLIAQTVTSNNNFSNIVLNFPTGQYGALGSVLFGIQIRSNITQAIVSNNHFSDININGTPGASINEDAISIQSPGTNVTTDSNTFDGIKINNVNIGLNLVAGTTSYFRNIEFNGGVTTPVSLSTPTFAETDFPVPFADLVACGSSLQDKRAVVNNSSVSTFGGTANGSGSTQVAVRCNGTNWTVVGN